MDLLFLGIKNTMINKSDKIFLTIELEGSVMVRHGEYKSAKVSFVNDGRKAKDIRTSGFKTIEEPKFKSSTQYIELGYSFIEGALSKPPRVHPKKYKDAMRRWNKMDDVQKLKINCEDLAESLGGRMVSFNLL